MNINKSLLTLSIPSLLFVAVASAQDASGTNATHHAAPATNYSPSVPAIPTNVVAQTGASDKTKTVPLLATGAFAPDFVSKDINGKEVRISGLRDKIVVLDFWATWCGPCKASLPHTQAAAKKYKAQGVVVLAVCTSDTRAKFEEFIKAHQEQYRDILFTCDPHEKGSANYSERASRALYGLASIPTQLVIGRDGKIADVIVGFDENDHRLEDALAKLVKQSEGKHEPVGSSKTDHQGN